MLAFFAGFIISKGIEREYTWRRSLEQFETVLKAAKKYVPQTTLNSLNQEYHQMKEKINQHPAVIRFMFSSPPTFYIN